MITNASAKAKILVLGSINMDLVARCASLPRPGETLTCTSFDQVFGGKGANQAIAAVRAGGIVGMIGRVGQDTFGERLRDNLMANQINCEAVWQTATSPSGLAMIVVADSGENQIVVIPGSNGLVSVEDVEHSEERIRQSDCLLLQLEVPLTAVIRAIELATKHGVRVILDPAPVPNGPVPDALFSVDLICPNETEARRLTQVRDESFESMQAAAEKLHQRGAKAIAITLGKHGTLVFDGSQMQRIPSIAIDAVDTTGAGDAFAGALAVRWSETQDLVSSIRWANIAGALAASRHGAQAGIAQRADIDSRWAHEHAT
jgi:ribokinase